MDSFVRGSSGQLYSFLYIQAVVTSAYFLLSVRQSAVTVALLTLFAPVASHAFSFVLFFSRVEVRAIGFSR
jgi:hypothetical protein